MDVQPVRDTPLVLMYWWHFDDQAPEESGRRVHARRLVRPKKPVEVWRQVLPGDYADAMGRIREDGAILRCDEPRRFDLHFVAEKKRVTFEVTPGPKGLGGDWVSAKWPERLTNSRPPSRTPRPDSKNCRRFRSNRSAR